MYRPALQTARLVAAALPCLLACGHASSGPGPLLLERVVVAPMNLAVELGPELQESGERVQDEILRQLKARPGVRLAVIFEAEAHALWRECLSIVSSSEDLPKTLNSTLSVFARELVRHDDFDLLLVPSLAWRDARIAGNNARWDGVRRRVTVRGPITASPDGATSGEYQIVSGLAETTGLSLHISSLTPTGRMAYEGWGGLDLVHDIVPAERVGSGRPRLVLQPDLLEDGAHVAEGVGLALGPYVSD